MIALTALAVVGGALARGGLHLASPAAAALPPATTPPPGFRFLDSAEFGVRLAVPEDLAAIRPWDLMEDEVVRGALQELADRSGTGVDEYLDDQFESIDVIAVAEDGTSVNVMRISSDTVPTPSTLAAEVAALQLQDVTFGEVQTAFGPATTMRSTTLLTDDQLAVPGHVLWARSPRGVFSIQLTAADAEVADALYGILLRTLQPV